MDAVDRQIIDQLTQNARTPFSALGRLVGLSTSATAARVRRLESFGIIRGYRVVLSEEVEVDGEGSGVEVFIDVRLQLGRDSREFLRWANRRASVLDAVHVTGAHDYLLHVRVRDTAALDELLWTMKDSAGAAQTHTRLALR